MYWQESLLLPFAESSVEEPLADQVFHISYMNEAPCDF